MRRFDPVFPQRLRRHIRLAFIPALALASLALSAPAHAEISVWGSGVAGDGRFGYITGIATGAGGDVYLADGAIGYTRIERFSASGSFINSWGSNGSGAGEFAQGHNGPSGVTAASSGAVYVTDPGNHRVQQFSNAGMFIREWSTDRPGDPYPSYPGGISAAPDGSVWVTDRIHQRVQQFTSTGSFVKQWSVPGNSFEDVTVTTAGVYVSDVNHQRVLRYDSDGNLLGSFGTFGSGPGQFDGPWGIGAGLNDGSVLVADQNRDRVQRFSPSGAFIASFGSPGSALGSFNDPRDIAAGPNQRVYVADLNNNRVVSFDLSPQARLLSVPLLLTGESVVFDASASLTQLEPISRYEWDLDGNGTFELDSGLDPTVQHSFASPGRLAVSVRVTALGGTDTAATPVDVRLRPPAGELGASINEGAVATNDPEVEISLRWPAYADSVLLSNDGGFDASQARSFTVQTPLHWRLRSSGPERLPKTIYVRFRGGHSGAETYTDDIILDETDPKVVSAEFVTAQSSSSAAGRSRTMRYRVRLRAQDNAAGIVKYQVASNRRKPPRPKGITRRRRQLTTTIGVKSRTSRLHVRVRDAAGNWSDWRRVRRKGSRH